MAPGLVDPEWLRCGNAVLTKHSHSTRTSHGIRVGVNKLSRDAMSLALRSQCCEQQNGTTFAYWRRRFLRTTYTSSSATDPTRRSPRLSGTRSQSLHAELVTVSRGVVAITQARCPNATLRPYVPT